MCINKQMKKKTVIFELADVQFASRARKEAFSLAKAGYNVTFVGISKKNKELSEYTENNIRIIAYPQKSKRKIINVLFFNAFLFKFFLQEKFDIYHLHNLESTFVAIFFKLLYRKKLIFDAHELNYHKRHNPERLRNKLVTLIDVFKERLLILIANVILQANEKRAELFAKHYNCKMPKIIENNEPIIEIDRSKSIRNIIDIPNNQIVLIFIGNITYGLNQSVDKVIEALPQINKNLNFYIIGNVIGNTKQVLLDIAKNNNVQNRVHFTGPVPFKDIVHFISGADISVIPIYATSLNSKFSALNKVSQSLMAGLPLVVSNYENLEQLINNGNTYIGETFDITTPKTIANAINNLLKKDLSIIKNNARKIAVDKVNWDNEAIKLIKIYSKL